MLPRARLPLIFWFPGVACTSDLLQCKDRPSSQLHAHLLIIQSCNAMARHMYGLTKRCCICQCQDGKVLHQKGEASLYRMWVSCLIQNPRVHSSSSLRVAHGPILHGLASHHVSCRCLCTWHGSCSCTSSASICHSRSDGCCVCPRWYDGNGLPVATPANRRRHESNHITPSESLLCQHCHAKLHH